MKGLLLIPVIAGLLVGAGVHAGLQFPGRLLILGAQPAGRQVYTVAQVQAGLLRNPAAWTDRTLWLRGTAVDSPCPPGFSICGPKAFFVDDDGPAPVFDQLPLDLHGDETAVAVLRRVPWLRNLLPRAPAIEWDMPATYFVRVQALPCAPISTACYEAVVQDAAR
jgi:hypothetical protein